MTTKIINIGLKLALNMKIIILLRIFWTAGAQKIAIKEAKELQMMGNDVELIFLRGKKFPEYDELLEGISYKIISENGNSLFSPIYEYITKRFMPDRGKESRVDYNLIRKFPKYIKDREVDYIICHDQLAGLAGYYCYRKLGIKYSVFVHERLFQYKNSLLGNIWKSYENKIFKNATKVFSITDKVAKNIKDIQKVDVITNYPGMNVNKITDFSQKENMLIAVAMWDYGRKPLIYLDIMSKIKNFSLYFVGNFRIEELEQQFKDKVKTRKLEEKIIMKQGVKESELIELYQCSKFVLRFGFGEYGLGTAAVEAIQNGVPLIINSDLGTADLVNKYSCGEVLDEISPEEIKKYITENNNESSYSKLQENIIKLSTDYSWRKHAYKLIDFIN